MRVEDHKALDNSWGAAIPPAGTNGESCSCCTDVRRKCEGMEERGFLVQENTRKEGSKAVLGGRGEVGEREGRSSREMCQCLQMRSLTFCFCDLDKCTWWFQQMSNSIQKPATYLPAPLT